MNPDFQKIKNIITSICDRSCSEWEINQFVNFCLGLAIAYLRVLEKKGYRIRESQSEHEFESIAADCLADLFSGGQDRHLEYVQKYLKRIHHDKLSDADLFIALRRLICKRVRQHLTKIFAQRDPNGAKLLRNVRLSVKRHDNLKLCRDGKGTYILYLTESNCECVNRPNVEKVKSIFSGIYRADMSIDMLVKETLKALSEIYERPVEVELNCFVSLIRIFRQAESNHSSMSTAEYIHKSLEESVIEKKVTSIVKEINDIIVKKYVLKRKLTIPQGTAMSRAIEDMSYDALCGDRLCENFEYLNRHWSDLTREKFLHNQN